MAHPHLNTLNRAVKYHKHAGVTLIEILLMLMLITILAAIVVPIYLNIPEAPELVKEKNDILRIKNALDLYKIDNGFYPTTQQGLKALVKKPKTPPLPKHWIPYLPSLPLDPWGGDYYYHNAGDGHEIELYAAPQVT